MKMPCWYFNETENALVKQFQKLLELDDVELEFEEGALIEIAKKQLNVKRVLVDFVLLLKA